VEVLLPAQCESAQKQANKSSSAPIFFSCASFVLALHQRQQRDRAQNYVDNEKEGVDVKTLKPRALNSASQSNTHHTHTHTQQV
jgi:hypothetical protein